MEVVLSVDDSVASDLLRNGEKSSDRRALELWAVNGYKRGKLSEYQVKVMLRFDSRFDVDAFLKEHGAYYDYTLEELDRGTASLGTLLKKHDRFNKGEEDSTHDETT
jgi:hypothetical protein